MESDRFPESEVVEKKTSSLRHPAGNGDSATWSWGGEGGRGASVRIGPSTRATGRSGPHALKNEVRETSPSRRRGRPADSTYRSIDRGDRGPNHDDPRVRTRRSVRLNSSSMRRRSRRLRVCPTLTVRTTAFVSYPIIDRCLFVFIKKKKLFTMISS